MNTIKKTDSDAITKTTRQIQALEKLQNDMKAINKICRSKLNVEDITIKLKSDYALTDNTIYKLLNPKYAYEKKGFQTWELTNNNASLKRYKDKLKEIEEFKSKENKTMEVNGVSVEFDYDDNRIRLYFSGKPDADVRATLKQNGFKWSPTNTAWQNFINPNSEYFIHNTLASLTI